MFKYIYRIVRKITPDRFLPYVVAMRLYLRKKKYSYSQKGEDLIVDSFFRKSTVQPVGISQGVYLDIGAYHPTCISNTALLHKKGWSGYAVDVDDYKLKIMKIARGKSVQTIRAAVTNENSENVQLYRFGRYGDWSDIDTINQEAAKIAVESWGKAEYTTTEINSININDLLAGLPHINFLNIDIEGADGPVVEELDLTLYPIELIMYEDNSGEYFDVLHEKFIQHNYKLILNCHGAVAYGKCERNFR